MFNKIAQSFTEKVALRLLALSAAVYILIFYYWCCLKYYGFVYYDFDLAVHDQIMWNILHGRIFNSILGIDFLGNHVHLISFLIAPFYWLFPHPLFLLFLQTLFLAAGVYPLYALARLYLSYQISLAVCLIYLLYPGLGYTNLYEFHPTCFATFFLLCTAYYFFKEKFGLFNVFMFLSLLCQENIALIFVMWGIYALCLKKSWKWVVWPTLIGVVYFLCCVYLILPTFNKNIFNFFQIYDPLGSSFGGVVQTCIFHPLMVLSLIFKPYKISYLVQIFVNVSFLPFFSPLALLPDLLIFLQHLLSSRGSELSLEYHYSAELIPFIFVAAIFGIRRIIGFGPIFKYFVYILLLNALIISFMLAPSFHLIKEWKDLNSGYGVVQKQFMIDQIPKNASVLSTFKFLPHLSHRENLYSFHYVYTGYYTLSDKAFHLPDNVQYALIDFNDYLTFFRFYRPEYYRNIANFFKQGSWGNIDVRNHTVLFKKGVKSKFPLFKIIDSRTVPQHRLELIVDDRIKLYGYDFKRQGEYISIIFYWKLLRPEEKDVNLSIDFIGQNGRIVDTQYWPICYRIWPTQAWQKNQSIADYQYIYMTPKLNVPIKCLKMKFYEFITGDQLRINSKDRWGAFELKLTN